MNKFIYFIKIFIKSKKKFLLPIQCEILLYDKINYENLGLNSNAIELLQIWNNLSTNPSIFYFFLKALYKYDKIYYCYNIIISFRYNMVKYKC